MNNVSIRLLLVSILWLLVLSPCMAGSPVKKGALKKECKQFYKKLKTEGWTNNQTGEDLSVAVDRYYEKLELAEDDLQQLVGYGMDKSARTARRKAELHAKSQFAMSKSANFKSHFSASEKSDGIHPDSTTLVLGTQANVNRQVKMPQPDLSVERLLPDGKTEVQLYYLYNHQ